MIITIEYIDDTPDEVHEDVFAMGAKWSQYTSLLHTDNSVTYVNNAIVRTLRVDHV